MDKIGKTVYTVNNKTGKIDEWDCIRKIKFKNEYCYCLAQGERYCFLPERCVFATEEKAIEVANK